MSNRLPAINCLRGIAIIAVIAHHSFAAFSLDTGFGAPLLTNGWLGVNLFFILSGFVLYLPYANGKPLDVMDFYRKRFWRLAPLFYFGALMSIGLTPHPGEGFYAQSAALLSGLFTLSPRYFFPASNMVLWSLGVEFLFSAAFPLIAIWLPRQPLRCVASIIVVSVAVRIFGYSTGHREYLGWLSASAIGRLDEFTFGACIAWSIFRKGIVFPRFMFAPGLLILGAAMFGFDQWKHGEFPIETAAGLIFLADLGLVLIVIDAVTSKTAFLSFRPLQIIGMGCYSLYVWHWILLNAFFPELSDDVLSTQRLRYFIYLGVLIGISAMTYRFIEFRSVRDWRLLFLLPQKPLRNGS
jgi:peptidoglycan/LPS O-acetylase OafA/YrhL